MIENKMRRFKLLAEAAAAGEAAGGLVAILAET